MDGRTVRTLILGMAIGGVVGAGALGGAAVAWGWSVGTSARGHEVVAVTARAAQAQLPLQTPSASPREFVPVVPPHNGDSTGPGQPSPGAGGNNPAQAPPSPGAGGGDQNCNQILFFYQGRLYQLRPPQDGNPEFFMMQPYSGPQIPGFPGPTPPGTPEPQVPSLPPTFKF